MINRDYEVNGPCKIMKDGHDNYFIKIRRGFIFIFPIWTYLKLKYDSSCEVKFYNEKDVISYITELKKTKNKELEKKILNKRKEVKINKSF